MPRDLDYELRLEIMILASIVFASSEKDRCSSSSIGWSGVQSSSHRDDSRRSVAALAVVRSAGVFAGIVTRHL